MFGKKRVADFGLPETCNSFGLTSFLLTCGAKPPFGLFGELPTIFENY